MLRPFEVHEPSTVAEASRLLGHHGEDAAVYAGGTELIPVMRDGLAFYRHLVNLKAVPALDRITGEGDMVRVGALATHRTIERSPVVGARAPVLAQVAAGVANLRVRNVGTLGGNLCFAEPHSDPAVLLIAQNASILLARDGGERRVNAEAFFEGILRTVRRHDEILVWVDVPALPPHSGAAYARFALHERPTAGVAVAVTLDGGAVSSVRIAVGSVGPMPARVPEAEEALVGCGTDARALRQAAARTGQTVEVLGDLYGSEDYKRHIVTVLAAKALDQAVARAARPTGPEH